MIIFIIVDAPNASFCFEGFLFENSLTLQHHANDWLAAILPTN